MSRDILSDSLATLPIVELDDEDQCNGEETANPVRSNLVSAAQPDTNVRTNTQNGTCCYYNHGIADGAPERYEDSLYKLKTNSLPAAYSLNKKWDCMVYSALCISPEDTANQLTLLDLPLLKTIRSEEMTTLGFSKTNKMILAPNVVACIQRFNRVTLWVIQEILNKESPKERAEMMSHFLKVAKKLYALHNLQSLFAIVSALQSASIYRLTHTWACLTRKDHQVFEKFAGLFSEIDNWSTLREYLKKKRPPCIPYLGVFLRDLVHIDIVHPVGSPHRSEKMATVLETLTKFQESEYTITPIAHIIKYLSSVRYIDELQRFVEDDQYNHSLKLEPAESSAGTGGGNTPVTQSPSHRPASATLRGVPLVQTSFNPTHRRCRSLGSKFRSASLPRNFHKVAFGGGTLSGSHGEESFNRTVPMGSVNLLDDTLLESPGSQDNTTATCLQPGDITSLEQYSVLCQGFLKRKTVNKEGRKCKLSSWRRYWVEIRANSLLFFAPKSLMSTSRSDFRREPCKLVPLEAWTVAPADGDSPETFQLINTETSTVYKFKAPCEQSVRLWLDKIDEVNSAYPVEHLPTNLMSFD